MKKWTAPDPEFSTVHEMRKLRMCEGCRQLGEALIVLAPPPKRGVPGRYTHGYCYARKHGMDAFKALPYEALQTITLSEMAALGFEGRGGFLRYDQICKAAKRRKSAVVA